jgi:hypothetical protein
MYNRKHCLGYLHLLLGQYKIEGFFSEILYQFMFESQAPSFAQVRKCSIDCVKCGINTTATLC